MTTDGRDVAIVADADELARRLAAFVVERARAAIARHGRFDLALAGGSKPKAAYAALAAPPLATAVEWSRVRFFFGDERCVGPDDDESNFKMARMRLFTPLRIAEGAVERMRGEAHPPSLAADAYALVLRGALERDARDTPVFDCVMLGMGPDGHTASLFPGTDPTSGDDALVRAPYVERLATHRITLTPRVINAARDVVIATAGGEKAAALADALGGYARPIDRPVLAVRPDPGRLTWLVDRDAAALLAAR
ncbi:MAG: 6-phosphogluconolactonase [Vulcanimicrobiaceae bacterium]